MEPRKWWHSVLAHPFQFGVGFLFTMTALKYSIASLNDNVSGTVIGQMPDLVVLVWAIITFLAGGGLMATALASRTRSQIWPAIERAALILGAAAWSALGVASVSHHFSPADHFYAAQNAGITLCCIARYVAIGVIQKSAARAMEVTE